MSDWTADDEDADPEATIEAEPRPPTRAPGMWRQIPLTVKVLLGVLIVVAIGGIVVVSQLSSESSASLDDGVIEQLIPASGSKIPQQSQVGIDLAVGYRADLAVNGIPVPEDQLTRVEGLDQVLFTPGPDKVVEQWAAGQNCVIATYYATDVGPQDSRAHSWCFTAF